MKQILIIDDEPQIRDLLKKMMEELGFMAKVASNGEDGMSLLKKEPVDLVITDIVMPKKEGIEVLSELKKKYPGLPAIVISGGGLNSPDCYLSVARLLGAYAIFEKPFENGELIDTVKKALKLY